MSPQSGSLRRHGARKRGDLHPVGTLWANLPPPPETYIKRVELEDKLIALLANDRHPIVTLVGRGGIGKTSVALRVLHEMSASNRFGAMLWFSARDIDLTQAGRNYPPLRQAAF